MKKTNQKFISIMIATIAAGIPISTVAPQQLNFNEPFFLITWCSLGIIGAFGIYLYYNLSMRDMIGTFIIGYMLAVIFRFIADIVINNITHTNLSLSLFYAMGTGALAGWIGSGSWLLLRKSSRKKK